MITFIHWTLIYGFGYLLFRILEWAITNRKEVFGDEVQHEDRNEQEADANRNNRAA